MLLGKKASSEELILWFESPSGSGLQLWTAYMSRNSWILQKLANIFHDPRLLVLWLISLCTGFKRARTSSCC